MAAARGGEGDGHEEGQAAMGELDHQGNRSDRALHGAGEGRRRANEGKGGHRPRREEGAPGLSGQGPRQGADGEVGG